MSELPSGTITFLFADLEGSTGLRDEHHEAIRRVDPGWSAHDALGPEGPPVSGPIAVAA